MLTIEITQYENPTIWYAGLVGKVFTEVVDTGTSYMVIGVDSLTNTVRYEDAKRITGIETKEELTALSAKYQASQETRRVPATFNTDRA